MIPRLLTLATVGALILGACASTADVGPRLVILDDGDVITIGSDGSDPVTIAGGEPGPFFQPVWSPDGSLVAFSYNDDDPAIYVADPDTGAVDFVTTDSFPFYFSWASANRLALLRNGGEGLLLDTVTVTDATLGELHTVETGQPLYYSWGPDGHELVAHIGTDRLVRSDLTTSEPLSSSPGFFQAPAWTSQGIIALELGTRDQRLTIIQTDGTSAPVATVSGPATFVASRDGSLLAVQGLNADQNAMTAAHQQLPSLPSNRLAVVPSEGGDQRTVTDGPVLAYFWSPVNDQLLVLDFVPGPQARWSIWDDNELRELVRFSPEPSFITEFVPFFDQYAQSVSLWAPDGSAFAFPGTIGGETGIWVQPVDDEPARISSGSWVSWSP